MFEIPICIRPFLIKIVSPAYNFTDGNPSIEYAISPSKQIIKTFSGSLCNPRPSDAPNEQNN